MDFQVFEFNAGSPMFPIYRLTVYKPTDTLAPPFEVHREAGSQGHPRSGVWTLITDVDTSLIGSIANYLTKGNWKD